jgi:hypothetical protein
MVAVLPVVPVPKYCAVYNLGERSYHGMEEVIGSIPIRSTNKPNNLGGFASPGLVAFGSKFQNPAEKRGF